MGNMDKEIKQLRIIFGGISALTLLAGLSFSFLIAITEDAPGIVIFGSAAALAAAACIYGVGQVVVLLKRNQEILSDIARKLGEKE